VTQEPSAAQKLVGDVYFNAHYAGQKPSRARLDLVRFTPGAQAGLRRARDDVGRQAHGRRVPGLAADGK
jgi:hypothetical protein